jgi:hypothetical protein
LSGSQKPTVFFSLFLVVLSIWNNRLSGSLKTTVCSVDRLFFFLLQFIFHLLKLVSDQALRTKDLVIVDPFVSF